MKKREQRIERLKQLEIKDKHTKFIYDLFSEDVLPPPKEEDFVDQIDSFFGSQISGSFSEIGKKLGMTVEDEQIYQRFRSKIKHNIDNGELVLKRYSCAIKQRILIQGHLYISTEAIYFFSPHNDENAAKFFSVNEINSTKIKIMMDQIGKVNKAKNMMFDNSIEVEVRYLNTKYDEDNPYENQYMNVDTIFFTSFLKRDECFELLESQIKKAKLKNMIDLQINQALDLSESDSEEEKKENILDKIILEESKMINK